MTRIHQRNLNFYPISITTYQSYYSPGYTISGYVNIYGKIYLPDPPVDDLCIHVCVRGQESAILRYESANIEYNAQGERERHHPHHVETHYCDKDSYGLLNIDRTIYKMANPTDHLSEMQLPFEFALPTELPPSITIPVGASFFETKYEIEVYLSSKDHDHLVFPNQIHTLAKVPIRILPLPSNSNMDCVPSYSPQRLPIHHLYCFYNGYMVLTPRLNSSTLIPNEDYSLVLSIENHSKANIRKLRISLLQDKTLKVGYHRKCKCERLFTKEVEFRRLLLNRKVHTRGNKNSPILETIPLDGIINVPSNILPTYNGRLINLRYYLELEIVTSAFRTNPKVKIEVQIKSS